MNVNSICFSQYIFTSKIDIYISLCIFFLFFIVKILTLSQLKCILYISRKDIDSKKQTVFPVVLASRFFYCSLVYIADY